jgi:hypothetical protein
MAQQTEGGFFRHRPLAPPPETVTLSEANRYLCAAAYLDDTYGQHLTAELIDNEHRAVAPSIGVDLGPVLRHCVQAQKLLLSRDALLTSLLMVGLVISPLLSIGLVIAAGILVGVAFWRRDRRLVLAAALGFLLLCFCAGPLALFRERSGLPSGSVQDSAGRYTTQLPGGTSASDLLAWLLVIGAGTAAVYTWWRLRVYRILTRDLASRQRHRPPPVPEGRVGRRLVAVAAAQWGNVTLHSNRGPFLGAGGEIHSWSMSLGLRRPDGAPQQIDPVELHQHVRDHLLAMRGEDLPERERISGLIVVDHIVATGERKLPDPLIDQVTRVPYAEATPKAIRAIIRHPQGSLRYYLRAVVGAEGRDVLEDERLVAQAQDQEIAVSTFLYLAVEGGMLYVEFVATVLPPILDSLHAIDRIVPERIVSKALRDALTHGFSALALAPIRLFQGLNTVYGSGRRMDQADEASREYRTYDYSARLSVRELAGDHKLHNYLQKLDAEKYYKLVERAITGAVLTFLDDRGVDTSEYLSRTTMVLNHGVMITGGTISGPVAAGDHATASTVSTANATSTTGGTPAATPNASADGTRT